MVAIALLGATICARAATLYVSATGSNPIVPYADWSTAATNIQDAVDAASAGDQVLVADGRYQASGRLSADGATNCVLVAVPLTLQSVNGSAATIINGARAMRCVYLTNGAALYGFTLTNGSAVNGGAILCQSTNAFVANCLVVSNSATHGAGVYSGAVSNCTIINNTVGYSGSGGGAYNCLLVNCTISNNRTLVNGGGGAGANGSVLSYCTLANNVCNGSGATVGGGVAGCTLDHCTLTGNRVIGAGSAGGNAYYSTLTNCVLTGGYSDFNGGGAYNCNLYNCRIANNSSINGGGVSGGLLYNCLITGNHAAGSGGGIYWTTTLYDCTVYGNSAGSGGGGYSCTLFNSIIYGNSGGNNYGDSFSYCCTPDLGGTGNITNAPLFVNAAGGDFHLQDLSPCINAGTNYSGPPAVDYDGNPRIVGGTVDIGAFENQNATVASGLPSSPTNLTATLQGSQVVLSWYAAPKAAGYNIYRAVISGGAYVSIAAGVLATNFTDSAITNGGTYYYFVTAVNSFGESAGSPWAIVYFVDHFTFASIAPQTSSVPFTVILSACNAGGSILTNFNGAAMLSAAGDHGKVPVTPLITTPFINGQWTGSVTVASAYPDTNVRLSANSNAVAGVSNPFNVIPPSIQLFNLAVGDMVYDPFAARIYATVPNATDIYSNCLLVIDPVFGHVETNYFLDNSPSGLALSDDGKFLYVAFGGTNAFGRFNLASHALDLVVNQGYDSTYYWLAEHVVQFVPLPGTPHSVAVVEAANGLNTRVRIFDDNTPRPNLLAGVLNDFPGTGAAASTTRFYAGSPFARLTVDATGVISHDSPSAPLANGESIKCQGGLVFTATGKVFNPETMVLQGTLTNCSILRPDLASGTIFAMGSHPVFGQADAWNLYAWNSTSLQLTGSLPVPGMASSPGVLIRWGTNGLAFCNGSQLFLVRTSLVPSVGPGAAGGAWPVAGPFQLSFAGDQYMPYTIWGSTNLMNWTPLGPPNLGSNGWFWFSDTNTASYPRRYYRPAISH